MTALTRDTNDTKEKIAELKKVVESWKAAGKEE